MSRGSGSGSVRYARQSGILYSSDKYRTHAVGGEECQCPYSGSEILDEVAQVSLSYGDEFRTFIPPHNYPPPYIYPTPNALNITASFISKIDSFTHFGPQIQ